MDREVWRAAVHGVTKSWTGLSDWTTATKQSSGPSSDTHSNVSWVLLKELRPPSRWRMVTSGWAQDSWTPPLFHNQPIRRNLHILQPSCQILPIQISPPRLLRHSGYFWEWTTCSPSLALQKIFLCSKLWCFSLFGLTGCWTLEFAFQNRGYSWIFTYFKRRK